MAKSLAIVGAGAKAAAIVARAAVLKDFLVTGSVPNIEVFESRRIAAAWDGDTGHTGHSSGYLTLCTPGEKDVGYPYVETLPSKRVKRPLASELHSRFSFSAYLIATGAHSDWVDRGRDHPTHARWAAYLKWVFKQAGVKPTHSEVTAIAPTPDGRWRVTFEGTESGTREFDGVVLTGTGGARSVPVEFDAHEDRIFDSESFWGQRENLLGLEDGTIAVAGDGGAAGAIVAWLIDRFAEHDVRIVSINPAGTLFPRGDGYAERRWFSDPSEWDRLSLEHRRQILAHTEVGVVSLRNKAVIDQSDMVEYRCGKALSVRAHDDELAIDVAYGEEAPVPLIADYLISAIGFDRWSLLDLVDDDAATSLCAAGSDDQRNRVIEHMLEDLSLPPVSGLPAGLHVPALSELARGPGMGNLGCLGLMAQAILDAYP